MSPPPLRMLEGLNDLQTDIKSSCASEKNIRILVCPSDRRTDTKIRIRPNLISF